MSKQYFFWQIIWPFIGIIAFIVCFIHSSNLKEYYIWLLPGIYSLLFFITPDNYRTFAGNIGIIILNIAMFIRYVAGPVIFYMTSELSSFANNYQNINVAVVLMIYEMAVIFLTLEISGRREERRSLRNNEEQIKNFELESGTFLSLIIISAVLFIAVVYKDLVSGLLVILHGLNNDYVPTAASGFINLIWEALCAWIYVYSVLRLYHKYRDNKAFSLALKAVVYTLVYILVTFIGSVSLSRWFTIISAVAALAFVCNLFYEHKKKIIAIIGIPALGLLVLITLYKNIGYTAGSGGIFNAFGRLFRADLFDSYFNGIVGVNNAVGLYKTGEYGLQNIFNDALNNMPVINHLLDPSKSTVYGYNKYIGRLFGTTGDQIIPLIGQGTIYFGYLFSPAISVCSVLITRKTDAKLRSSHNYMTFAYAFCSAWFGVEAMMLNMTINMSWIYIRIIPLILVLGVSNLILSRGIDRTR